MPVCVEPGCEACTHAWHVLGKSTPGKSPRASWRVLSPPENSCHAAFDIVDCRRKPAGWHVSGGARKLQRKAPARDSSAEARLSTAPTVLYPQARAAF
eukprot:358842-Chlamydomonas_euryale.AAC.4